MSNSTQEYALRHDEEDFDYDRFWIGLHAHTKRLEAADQREWEIGLDQWYEEQNNE